jgi:hypothetical protein
MGFIEALASLAASAHIITTKITPWLDRMEHSMTQEEARELLKKVKANMAILDSCKMHDFEPCEGLRFSTYKCRNCGGELNGNSVIWYRHGLAHARGEL